jgi:hypothetical protein
MIMKLRNQPPFRFLTWAYSSILKMEAVHSTDISVNFYQTTRRHITQDTTLYSINRHNPKSHTENKIDSLLLRIVGWGTTLQAGRSRVRVPMRPLYFFSWPNPTSRTIALGSTQPLKEMSTRNLPEGKGRPALKTDNLTAIYEPIV